MLTSIFAEKDIAFMKVKTVQCLLLVKVCTVNLQMITKNHWHTWETLRNILLLLWNSGIGDRKQWTDSHQWGKFSSGIESLQRPVWCCWPAARPRAARPPAARRSAAARAPAAAPPAATSWAATRARPPRPSRSITQPHQTLPSAAQTHTNRIIIPANPVGENTWHRPLILLLFTFIWSKSSTIPQSSWHLRPDIIYSCLGMRHEDAVLDTHDHIKIVFVDKSKKQKRKPIVRYPASISFDLT